MQVKYPDGPLMRQRREALGLSYLDVAHALKWSTKSLSWFESGDVWPLPEVAARWDALLAEREEMARAEA